LRLAQDSSRITGSAYLAGKSFDVNGLVDSNQNLIVSTPPTPTFALDELRLHGGPAGLTGTVRYTGGPMTVQGHITSAKRGPLESTQLNVQGTWMGDSLVRSCTFTGLPNCPLLSRIFRLTLSQTGTTATGNLDLDVQERFRIPVRGTFSGGALSLAGAASVDGGALQLRLVA